MTPPRPLPDVDQPWVHPGWGNPNGPQIGTLIALSATALLAAWIAAEITIRNLRRQPNR